jgi:hypothetical protein
VPAHRHPPPDHAAPLNNAAHNAQRFLSPQPKQANNLVNIVRPHRIRMRDGGLQGVEDEIPKCRSRVRELRL